MLVNINSRESDRERERDKSVVSLYLTLKEAAMRTCLETDAPSTPQKKHKKKKKKKQIPLHGNEKAVVALDPGAGS